MALILSGDTGVPASGMPAGSVIQTVQATTTSTTTSTSTSFADTALTVNITPQFSTSKILVLVSATIYFNRASANSGAKIQLVRNSTNLISQTESSLFSGASGASGIECIQQPFMQYLDSPATTSSTTYKVQFGVNAGTTGYFSWNGNPSFITVMEIKV